MPSSVYLLPARLGAAALSAALLGANAHAASYSVSVNAASGTINLSGPTRDDVGSGNSPVSRSTNSYQFEATPPGLSSGSGWGSSAAAATATAGALHLRASSAAAIVSTNGGAMVGQGGSSAAGYLSDSFIINAGSCGNALLCGAGAVGTFSFSIDISGAVGGSGNYTTTTVDGGNGGWSGSAEWNLGGGISAGYVPDTTAAPSYVDWLRGEQHSADQRGPLPPVITGSGAGSQSYTISFVFGQAISFAMQGQVYSRAGANYDFYASQNSAGGSSANSQFAADLGHTMAWGGIAQLRDADGTLLTDFSALSADSGFDYRNAYAASAVPEPGSVWLFVAGAALLFGSAYRRRASQAAAPSPAATPLAMLAVSR